MDNLFQKEGWLNIYWLYSIGRVTYCLGRKNLYSVLFKKIFISYIYVFVQNDTIKILKKFLNSHILENIVKNKYMSRSKFAFLQFCHYIFQITDSTSKISFRIVDYVSIHQNITIRIEYFSKNTKC